MLLFVLMMVGANAVDRELPPPLESSATLEYSLNLGYGYTTGSRALLRPRLTYERPRFSVSVGAPVMLGAENAGFNDPEAWASWLEALKVDLDGVALHVGPLSEYGGKGLSVDRLTSRLGPVDLRSGAQVEWDGRRHRLRVASDGLLDVRVLAVDFDSSLLEGESTRLHWSATGAVDPGAPSRLGPTPIFAADLALRLDQSLTRAVSLSWQVALGSLFRDRPAALGGDSGITLRFGPADRHLAISGGLRWAGEGFIGSYFDRLYASERDSFEGVAKADLEQARGWVGRASIATRLDGFGMEIGFEQGALPGRLRLDATVAIADDDWQLRAIGAQRAIGSAVEVVELAETTYLSLDFSHRIWRSFFAFAAANQRTVDGLRVREGFAGVGFGQSYR